VSELFSVYQFFADGTYEQVRYRVSAEEAVKAARHYCSSVGAQLGTTRRVIITDDGDSTVFEWQHGKGVIFPHKTAGFQPIYD
jgi:hypothetical protein